MAQSPTLFYPLHMPTQAISFSHSMIYFRHHQSIRDSDVMTQKMETENSQKRRTNTVELEMSKQGVCVSSHSS